MKSTLVSDLFLTTPAPKAALSDTSDKASAISRGRYRSKYAKEVAALFEGNAGKALSAGDAYLMLTAAGSRIGQTTVYRSVCRLAEEGVLTPIRGQGDRDTRYIYCCEKSDHYHLICTECGRVRHLSCDMLKTLYLHIEEEHGFSVLREKTSLYGICSACKRDRMKIAKEHIEA